MFSLFFFVLLVIQTSLASYFSCYTEVQKGSGKDGTVHHGIHLEVTYARDDLSIYPHSFTKYVNVLNDQLSITIKSDEAPGTSTKFSAAIEGYATVNPDKTLGNCNLDIKTLASQDFLDNRSFKMLKPCIEFTFCEQQGKITHDDYLRADLIKHNFGNSAAAIVEILRNNRNAANSYENRNDTQATLNLVFDQTLAAIIRSLTAKGKGMLSLPDVSTKKEGAVRQIFQLRNGTLEGLKGVHRLNDLQLTHHGVRFTAEFKIAIPNIHLKFDKIVYKAGIVPLLSNSVRIHAKSIIIGIKMSADYSHEPCQAKLNLTQFSVESIKLKSSQGMEGYIKSAIANFVLENFKENLLGIIRAQVELLFASASQKVVCDIKFHVNKSEPVAISDSDSDD